MGVARELHVRPRRDDVLGLVGGVVHAHDEGAGGTGRELVGWLSRGLDRNSQHTLCV
jgi:hypothetical protein